MGAGNHTQVLPKKSKCLELLNHLCGDILFRWYIVYAYGASNGQHNKYLKLIHMYSLTILLHLREHLYHGVVTALSPMCEK